jgi:hypothetical protein
MSDGLTGRLREEFKAHGARALVTAPLRVVRVLGRTRQVWFYTQAASGQAPTQEVEELTAADWPGLQTDETFPWRADADASGRFAAGAQLFSRRDAGRRVAYGWVTCSPRFLVGELGGWVEFEHPVRWIWDCVTPEAHRGRGHYPQLLRELVARGGAVQPVIYCTRENVSSQRGIEKAGFLRSFTITERWPTPAFRTGPLPLKFTYHRAA